MTEAKKSIAKNSKPFLRWAGGKKWLLKELDKFVDIKNYNSYHEPFIGGGAVFFHLSPQNAIISDINKELIETYNAIKTNPEEVIKQIHSFEKSKDYYYLIRNQKFSNEFKEAARFIYLNQMSFNGLYRVNSRGEYNVPYGYRNNYQFDFDNILKASSLLKNAQIIHQDFTSSIENIRNNDLVFLDPPYTVTHNLNGFIHYNKKLFSLEDQFKLADAINRIKNAGAYYILTNAAHQTIREIFNNGDKMYEIDRASLIGGKNAKRGNYAELILTNIVL
ncbi:Dam family site-specific DNA-(adenine-N6)-methyltransferase [Paludibacter sp.]|uniref:DNA adenine methylase n=1 Tax=Paludibacter sp. TaxID=1898105 RepID=UPI001355EFF3|nr:Dam family site-specific DNA-(adenine-N6)-methyltransferase [Paludibacter sp.]MTK53640.1 Dam family site-specific DNA-(adenine-N6)-methyltransferase [Paludibacter sp.]